MSFIVLYLREGSTYESYIGTLFNDIDISDIGGIFIEHVFSLFVVSQNLKKPNKNCQHCPMKYALKKISFTLPLITPANCFPLNAAIRGYHKVHIVPEPFTESTYRRKKSEKINGIYAQGNSQHSVSLSLLTQNSIHQDLTKGSKGHEPNVFSSVSVENEGFLKEPVEDEAQFGMKTPLTILFQETIRKILNSFPKRPIVSGQKKLPWLETVAKVRFENLFVCFLST